MNQLWLLETGRYVHIAAGSVVLLLGLIQIVLPRHGKWHKKLGNAYYGLMWVVFLTALPISLYKANYFLTSVAFFAMYMALSGRRQVRQKNNSGSATDRWISIVALISSLSLIALAVVIFIGQHELSGIVPAVFGLIMLGMVRNDCRLHFCPAKSTGSMRWYYTHLGRMIGSYIAAFTAFLVNVQPWGAHWFNWLLPTVIGSAVIWYKIYTHRKKLSAVTK